MSLEVKEAVATIADFVASATVSGDARGRAANAFKDTIGVILAGTGEPAARVAQSMAAEEGVGDCRILGTPSTTSPRMEWPHIPSITTTCASCRSRIRVAHWCQRCLPLANWSTRARLRFSTPTSSDSSWNAGWDR